MSRLERDLPWDPYQHYLPSILALIVVPPSLDTRTHPVEPIDKGLNSEEEDPEPEVQEVLVLPEMLENFEVEINVENLEEEIMDIMTDDLLVMHIHALRVLLALQVPDALRERRRLKTDGKEEEEDWNSRVTFCTDFY